MNMLKKIFKSEPKYYLQLDESKDSQVVQTAVKTAEKASEAVKEKATKIAKSEPVQEAVKTVEKAQKSAKAKAAKATSTEGKASQNGKSATKEVKTTAQKSGASSYEPPFWVAAMNKTNTANSNGNGNGNAGEATFATDNLMPTVSKYRRNPGGSLAKFRAMAKTARTPKR